MKRKNNPHRLLLNDDVLNFSVNEIRDLLELDSGPNSKYSDRDIIYHLLSACTSKISISQLSNLCEDAPTEGDVRYRLRDLDLDELQKAFNDKLKVHALKTISNKNLKVAADLVTLPFYGKEETDGDTIKSKPKEGTSQFYAYASIYVILQNKRYTLAIKYVRKGETLKDIINFLIKEIEDAGFKIRGLFLDREFYTVNMINYLLNRKIPFIIPCVNRGPSGGIRKLYNGRKSYSTEYTMRSKENESTFKVNIVVKYSKGKYKKEGVKYFAYAVNGMNIELKNTFKEYRKRFGIESSYRLMNQARIHTSTKKPVLRLLYIGLGLFLLNIWIYIQWKYLSTPRQGGRQPVTWPFKTMLKQISRASEEKLGFIKGITL
jgi:putative transposase